MKSRANGEEEAKMGPHPPLPLVAVADFHDAASQEVQSLHVVVVLRGELAKVGLEPFGEA